MTVTATDELAALDWKAGTPCEGTGHYEDHRPMGDAKYIQHGTCPACGIPAPEIRICEGGRLYRLTRDLICHLSGCGKSTPTDDWGFTFTPIKES